MNKMAKDMLRQHDEPVAQKLIAQIDDLEKQVASYKATGITPKEIGEMVEVMKNACLLCCNKLDEATPTNPKINGCIHDDCEYHKWRAKWIENDSTLAS